MPERRTARSACRMCHGVCQVRVHLEDDRVVKVTGDSESPISRGYLCPKGKASPALLYHPDRLTHPLRRVGARGYATTKPACIQWGQALDTSACNIQTARSLLILRALTGNVDVPGGDSQWLPPEGLENVAIFNSPEQRGEIFLTPGDLQASTTETGSGSRRPSPESA